MFISPPATSTYFSCRRSPVMELMRRLAPRVALRLSGHRVSAKRRENVNAEWNYSAPFFSFTPRLSDPLSQLGRRATLILTHFLLTASLFAAAASRVTAPTFTAISEIHWTMRCALRDRGKKPRTAQLFLASLAVFTSNKQGADARLTLERCFLCQTSDLSALADRGRADFIW